MMRRYIAFKKAVITLQAHWRGYIGRRTALEVKRNQKAIIVQKYTRGYLKRWVLAVL